jgi:CelD/BcsL family acetyltransferase involved in cellulose biosynthesis
LPLFAERRRIAGVPARVLRSLSDEHSQRFDLLAHPDDDQTARALFAHLQRDRSWDVLELREAPAAGAAVDRLIDAASGHPIGRWDAMSSPTLPLPTTIQALEQQQSAKFRSNLRRRKKKLESDVGPIALERLPNRASRDELDRALAEAYSLEAAGWKGEAGTAIACDPLLTTRYTQIARAFAARDQLALYFLTIDGVRKAFHFALIEDGVYYLLKPGYDPELAQYGLGHLLVDAVVRDLVGTGVSELDFLGDDLPWKREWTDRVRPHVWRYVFARTPFGRALHAWKFSLAPRIKRLLRR